MNDAVTVAMIAAVPGTIAALGAWRSSAAGRRTLKRVDQAVNHQPADAPTLVEKIDAIGTDIGDVKDRLAAVDGRLKTLERKVG
jgi:hypothetical protein